MLRLPIDHIPLLTLLALLQVGLYVVSWDVFFLGAFVLLAEGILISFADAYVYSLLSLPIFFYLCWRFTNKALVFSAAGKFLVAEVLIVVGFVFMFLAQPISAEISCLLSSAIIVYLGLRKIRAMVLARDRAIHESFVGTNRIVKLMRGTEAELEKKIQERTQELKETVVILNAKGEDLLHLNQEKNAILGLVVHDLKAPLYNINLLTYPLTKEVSELVQSKAQRILSQTERMNTIITNLLSANAIESGELPLFFEDVNLHSLCSIVCEEFREHAKSKQIELEFHSQTEHVGGRVDRNATHQIMSNLISNALKYSPLGSQVWVKLDNDSDVVRVSVKDSGPGISKTDQEKLFRKFQKLSAQPTAEESSTGLGLFVVKLLTEAQKGRIFCRSEFGNGATFVLEMPRAKTSGSALKAA